MRMLLVSRWTWKIFHLSSLRVRLPFSVCVLGRSFENTITWGGVMQSVCLLYLLMNIMSLKNFSKTPYMWSMVSMRARGMSNMTTGSMLYPQKISDALVIDHYDRKKPHTLGIMVFGFWFVIPPHS